jgi:hypothetical protein
MNDREAVAWMYTGIKNDGTPHGPHLIWSPFYMDAMSAEKGALAIPLYAAPQQQAEPVADADEESALKAIKLPCAVRIGHGTHGKGTSVWTLVLRARALYQTVVDRDQKQAEPLAWRYKGEPWFDGDHWHDKYEVTTDERVARFKDKNAQPLYTAPQQAEPVQVFQMDEKSRQAHALLDLTSSRPSSSTWTAPDNEIGNPSF